MPFVDLYLFSEYQALFKELFFFIFYIVALSNILEVASIVQCTYFYKRTEELEKKNARPKVQPLACTFISALVVWGEIHWEIHSNTYRIYIYIYIQKEISYNL